MISVPFRHVGVTEPPCHPSIWNFLYFYPFKILLRGHTPHYLYYSRTPAYTRMTLWSPPNMHSCCVCTT